MSSPSRILRYHLFDFLGALFVETAFTLIQDRSQHRGQRSWIKVDYQREEQLHVVWQTYLLDEDWGGICFWWCISAHLCDFSLGFGCSPDKVLFKESWQLKLGTIKVLPIGSFPVARMLPARASEVVSNTSYQILHIWKWLFWRPLYIQDHIWGNLYLKSHRSCPTPSLDQILRNLPN